MSKQTILTGLRANNDLQIGNYFGALLPLVEMAQQHADDYQINLFMPDLHSFVTPVDHQELRDQIKNTIVTYAAAGLPLDKPNVNIYRQSYIPAHSELTWILNCFTGMGMLGRMTQYKDKAAKLGDEQINVGLFDYPVLMAADILLYGANYVPVGDDQTQHLEFTRDIAERMNSKFGELFVVPEPVKKQHSFFGGDQGLRIKDLNDPTKKMSKSDESGKGVLFLNDPIEVSVSKVMAATTDSVGIVRFDPDHQPGIANLLQILALLEQRDLGSIIKEHEGRTKYGDFKREVATAVEEFLMEFQLKRSSVNEEELLSKLESSEEKMRQMAGETLYRVQQAVGLR